MSRTRQVILFISCGLIIAVAIIQISPQVTLPNIATVISGAFASLVSVLTLLTTLPLGKSNVPQPAQTPTGSATSGTAAAQSRAYPSSAPPNPAALDSFRRFAALVGNSIGFALTIYASRQIVHRIFTEPASNGNIDLLIGGVLILLAFLISLGTLLLTMRTPVGRGACFLLILFGIMLTAFGVLNFETLQPPLLGRTLTIAGSGLLVIAQLWGQLAPPYSKQSTSAISGKNVIALIGALIGVSAVVVVISLSGRLYINSLTLLGLAEFFGCGIFIVMLLVLTAGAPGKRKIACVEAVMGFLFLGYGSLSAGGMLWEPDWIGYLFIGVLAIIIYVATRLITTNPSTLRFVLLMEVALGFLFISAQVILPGIFSGLYASLAGPPHNTRDAVWALGWPFFIPGGGLLTLAYIEALRSHSNTAVTVVGHPLSRRSILLGLVTLGSAIGGSMAIWQKLPYLMLPHPHLLSKYQGDNFLSGNMSWSPDGRSIATGYYNSTIHIWNAVTGQHLYTYQTDGGWNQALAWSPDSKRVASAEGDEKTVQVWDATNGGHELTYQGHTKFIIALAWSPDGTKIVSASFDSTTQIWNASTGDTIASYNRYISSILAWSPDGKYIVSSDGGKTIDIWDPTNGKVLFSYGGHADTVYCATWSPDSKYIASASADKTVQIWDASTGKRAYSYQGHADAVYCATWSPDGTQIASASRDQVVQIWDATNGGHVSSYLVDNGNISALEWPQHEQLSLIASTDHDTINIWKLT